MYTIVIRDVYLYLTSNSHSSLQCLSDKVGIKFNIPILGSQTSVDEASAEFSKSIDLAASHSFKKKRQKKK
jgi:hypothetical protein